MARETIDSFDEKLKRRDISVDKVFEDFGIKSHSNGNCIHCNGTGYRKIEHKSLFGSKIEYKKCEMCNGTGNIVVNNDNL